MSKTDAEICRLAGAVMMLCRDQAEEPQPDLIERLGLIMAQVDSPEEFMQIFMALGSAATAFCRALCDVTGKNFYEVLATTLDIVEQLDDETRDSDG